MSTIDLTEKVIKLDKFALCVTDGNVISGKSIEKYETARSYVWLINPNGLSIDYLKLEELDNLNNHVYDIDGIWACLLKNKDDGSFKAITSAQNELPWYYSDGIPFSLSTNIFLLTKNLKQYTVNYDAISSFLAFDFCYDGETFIKQIKKSYGGDIIHFNKEKFDITGLNLNKWLGFDETVTDRKIILDLFVQAVNESLQYENPQITLTAGSDSRAILGAAYHSKQNFKLMTGTPSSVDKRDIKVPKQISKLLGIEHFSIDESNIEVIDLESSLNDVAIVVNSLFTPRNWLIYYKEYLLNQDYLKNISRLMGYRGEFFKGFYGDIDLTLWRKTSFLKNIYRKNTIDIAKDKFNYYHGLSGIYSKELFYQRERDNFWVSSNIRSFLESGLKIFTPFSDNELLKMGYRFTGGIKKVNLHELAINLLPPQVRDIPTKEKKIIMLTKRIISNLSNKNDYSYFLKPNFINKNLNIDILCEIIPVGDIKNMMSKYQTLGNYDGLVHKMFAVSHFFELKDGQSH